MPLERIEKIHNEEKICTCKEVKDPGGPKFFLPSSEGNKFNPDSSFEESSVDEIFNSCPEEVLVPAEVLIQLLKIQSKYLDDHPCLCTSRFRHTLHQLENDNHKKLAKLCRSLQSLTTQSSELLYETTLSYKSFVRKIFEIDSLRTHASVQENEELQTSVEILHTRLEAILARLVSDYRAIFAIEEQQACKLRSEESQKFDHEHRKRHEEEDECPEEIKLMKVAWAELSLKCPFKSDHQLNQPSDKSPHGDQPDQINRKERSNLFGERSASEVVLEDVVLQKKEEEAGLRCVEFIEKYNAVFREKVSSPESKTPPNEPAQGSSTEQPKCKHGKPRKRKERTESTSEQDRKFSRSSSEVFDDSACDFESCNSIKRCHSSTAVPALSSGEAGNSNNGRVIWEIPDGINSANFRTTKLFYQSDDEVSCSSNTFPTSTATITSAIIINTNNNNNKCNEERRIAHPRKQRKERSDSFKENFDRAGIEGEDVRGGGGLEQEDSQSSCDSTVSNLSTSVLTAQNKECSRTNIPSSTRKILNLSIPEIAVHNDDDNDNALASSIDNSSKEDGTNNSFSAFKSLGHSHHQQGAIFDRVREHQHQPLAWTPYGLRREYHTPEEEEDASSVAFRMVSSHKYLDPAHIKAQRRSTDPEMPRRGKLKQLKRQLHNVRRKLESLELDFECNQGYRPSHADKQTDNNMSKLLNEQFQLKRQIRSQRESDLFLLDADDVDDTSSNHSSTNLESVVDLIDEDSSSSRLSGVDLGDNNNSSCRDLESMRNSLYDMETQLRAQRKLKGRPQEMEDMTTDQLHAEKTDIQSALLQFEQMFGHPETDKEKALTKNIYDRYRQVKRLARRSSASRSKEQQELETIPEDEALPLTLASPPHRINIEVTTSGGDQRIDSRGGRSSSSVAASLACEGFVRMKSSSAVNGRSIAEGDEEEEEGENLHAMSRYELLQVLRKVRDEKKVYRRKVKEREENFRRETGRRLLKEDRDHSENVYQLYKNSKAKIKLIDALLSKKVNHYF